MNTLDATADLHVAQFTTLPTPGDIAAELPVGDERAALVSRTRDEVRAIMSGRTTGCSWSQGPAPSTTPTQGSSTPDDWYGKRRITETTC